jgi:hypothetical protein
MCLLLVYPKIHVNASVFVEEKVAKRRVMQTERLVLVFWYVKNGMQAFQHSIDSLLWDQYKHA